MRPKAASAAKSPFEPIAAESLVPEQVQVTAPEWAQVTAQVTAQAPRQQEWWLLACA